MSKLARAGKEGSVQTTATPVAGANANGEGIGRAKSRAARVTRIILKINGEGIGVVLVHLL